MTAERTARRLLNVMVRKEKIEFDLLHFSAVAAVVERALCESKDPLAQAVRVGAALEDCPHVLELYATDDEIHGTIERIRRFAP